MSLPSIPSITIGLSPSKRVLLSAISVAVTTAITSILAADNNAGIPQWVVTLLPVVSGTFVIFREWYGYARPPIPENPPQ